MEIDRSTPFHPYDICLLLFEHIFDPDRKGLFRADDGIPQVFNPTLEGDGIRETVLGDITEKLDDLDEI